MWCNPIMLVRKLSRKEPRARYGRYRVIGHEMLLSRRSRSRAAVALHGSSSLDTRGPSGIHAGAFCRGAPMSLPIFPSLLLSPLLFPLQACRNKQTQIPNPRDYIFLPRVKEGHGAGERQRSESGLGNADIDVRSYREGLLCFIILVLRMKWTLPTS